MPRRLPPTGPRRSTTFAGSEIAADIFGADYRAIYAAVRRDEIAQLTTAISQIEYRTYLGRL
jgi:glutamine synthetase